MQSLLILLAFLAVAAGSASLAVLVLAQRRRRRAEQALHAQVAELGIEIQAISKQTTELAQAQKNLQARYEQVRDARHESDQLCVEEVRAARKAVDGLSLAFANLQSQAKADYKQIEALFNLFNQLELRAPLPPMRGWAASPDFCLEAFSEIRRNKPSKVVELGSGVSSIVIGYALQSYGGRLISLEHDEAYAARTTQWIAEHGLIGTVDVVLAPLTTHEIGGEKWLWYDFDKANLNKAEVQMVVVDGPPGDVQRYARYPAWPLLWSFCSEDVVVLLDDASRPDEKEVVKRWTATGGLAAVVGAAEKGIVRLESRREAFRPVPNPNSGTSRQAVPP